MLATTATPGQDSLRVLGKKAAPTAFGIAVIKNVKTGQSLRYTIPAAARVFLDACNKKPERERFDAVMNAPEASLFHTEALTASSPNGRNRR